MSRLKARVGGFVKYTDQANIYNPDPISTHFVAGKHFKCDFLEADRFDKDFAVADRRVREVVVDKKHTSLNNLRQERMQRDLHRWDHMEHEEKKQEERIIVKAEVYGAAKKNKGGSAYNIIDLNYMQDKDGKKLQQIDDDARVRALMRTRVLDKKNNNTYNPITGEDRFKINVPHHERYNPILTSTGNQVVTASRRSVASGIVPGLN